jgi:hypothetical protein
MAGRKPNLEDNLRGAWRSFRNGTGMNPFATRREVMAAHDERVTQSYPRADGDKQYYSMFNAKYGKMGYFVDRNGNPTTSYPHVHVVISEQRSVFEITASRGKHDHPQRETLPIMASGNEVNAAIARMARYL